MVMMKDNRNMNLYSAAYKARQRRWTEQNNIKYNSIYEKENSLTKNIEEQDGSTRVHSWHWVSSLTGQ